MKHFYRFISINVNLVTQCEAHKLESFVLNSRLKTAIREHCYAREAVWGVWRKICFVKQFCNIFTNYISDLLHLLQNLQNIFGRAEKCQKA